MTVTATATKAQPARGKAIASWEGFNPGIWPSSRPAQSGRGHLPALLLAPSLWLLYRIFKSEKDFK
jgi:hypothetical protein